MAYSFQTFSYLQVFTSVQANQLEENILKHEHGVTTNCQALTLYAALSENETITGQWTLSRNSEHLFIIDADGTANQKRYLLEADGGYLYIHSYSDAPAFVRTILALKQSNGYVGIGTTTPGYQLTVRSSGTPNIVWENPSYLLGALDYESTNHGLLTLYTAGVYSLKLHGQTGQFRSAAASGVPPLILDVAYASGANVTNLSADMVDGYHASNSTASIPISNGTVNTNLSADMVDGLHTTVIQIGDWNMDTTTTANIAHGLTLSKIRDISVVVRNDLDSEYFPIEYAGGVSCTATNAVIVRNGAGVFDDVLFDSASYNRGWITIQHIP